MNTSYKFIQPIDKINHFIYNFIYNTKNEIINIGSPDENKIIDVARVIMSQLELDDKKLELHPDQPGSTRRRLPDLTKLNSLVPDFQYTTLEEGIRRILDGIKS